MVAEGQSPLEREMSDKQVRKLERQFKGLWIPAAIINRTGLSALEKMLWADIDSFSGKDSTWFKSRKRAARDMCVSEVTISRALRNLRDSGLVEMVKNDGRVMHYVSTLPRQNDDSPESIVAPQGHQIDDIDNKTEKQISKQHRGRPTDQHEVEAYFQEKGSTVGEAAKFTDYYTANGWTQGRASKAIKDWKAAARNWIRNEQQFRAEKRGFQPENFTANGIGNFIAGG